ncbi:hypothetical protein PGB90_002483 [Kerria lacca]
MICCGRLYCTVSYYPATVIVGIPPFILDVTARNMKKAKEKSWSIPGKVLLNDQIPINDKWQAWYDGSPKAEWMKSLLPVVGRCIPPGFLCCTGHKWPWGI